MLGLLTRDDLIYTHSSVHLRVPTKLRKTDSSDNKSLVNASIKHETSLFPQCTDLETRTRSECADDLEQNPDGLGRPVGPGTETPRRLKHVP